jgi:hypothetical protein
MQTALERKRRDSAGQWRNLTMSDLYRISKKVRRDEACSIPFTIGVEKGTCPLCRFPVPIVIAIALSESSEVVKGIVPPESNCESLPRYWSCPEDKEKVFQLAA